MVAMKRGKRFFPFLLLLSIFTVAAGSLLFQTSSLAQESRESRLSEIYELNRIIEETGANWVAGETSLSGLSPEEKKGLLGSMTPPISGEEELLFSYQPLGVLPSSLDWRSNGGNFVTPIRNQSSCGSCWAFATTAALESAVLIYSNSPGSDLNLSEQVMVSCGASGTNDAGGCGGGYVSYASDHIRNTGLPLETCYPYTNPPNDGNCSSACANWQSSAYRIASWNWVATTSPTVDAIKNALSQYGPLVTTFRVYEDFYDYVEGVYSYVSGGYLGGHAVLLVGYNDNGQYFIVKNSWGTWWGEDGYFKIAYSEVNGTTQFGDYTIAYGPAIPPNGETVSAPSSLSGTTSGTTNTPYSYSTGGSTSSSGHSVQYLFDWGDGTNSGWLAVGTTSASKSWTSPGTYSVRSQGRCSIDTPVVSPWSGSLGVTVVCPTPGTPSSPSPANGAAGVSTSPTLSWIGSGATSYDVYFGTTSNPPLVTTTSNTTYSPGSLGYGTTYYWKIIARNNCGGSATGMVWSFTTVCAPLGTPSSPTPSNGATSVSTTPTLSWSGSNASSYDVYFGTASNPPLVTTTPSATYSPSLLSSNTTYYWKVVAKNGCGNSEQGPVWSFTTACGTPGAPSVSSPLDGAAGISTTPTLTWSSSGASSYDVYFGAGSSPSLVVSGTTSVSYSPGNLSNNTKYSWKIVARNSCGGSTTGSVWSFTTACVASGTPTILTPANGATGVTTSLALSWTASNASSYDVYFGTSPSPSLVTTTSSTTYNASGLNNNVTYYWKIVTRNACGDLTAGPVWSFTTVTAPGTPVTVIGPNGGETLPMGSAYTIGWNAPTQATRFNLAYSTNNGSTWKTIAKNVTGSSYTWQVPALKTSQKNCRIRVTGFDSQGAKVGEDRSDSTFAIQGVRVTGPTLGEMLTSGSTHTITWETVGPVGPVGDARIYYSKNGGGGWTLIGTVPGETNSYLWTVPSTKGVVRNSCRVRVVLRDTLGKTLTADMSDGYFTMQPAGSQ